MTELKTLPFLRTATPDYMLSPVDGPCFGTLEDEGSQISMFSTHEIIYEPSSDTDTHRQHRGLPSLPKGPTDADNYKEAIKNKLNRLGDKAQDLIGWLSSSYQHELGKWLVNVGGVDEKKVSVTPVSQWQNLIYDLSLGNMLELAIWFVQIDKYKCEVNSLDDTMDRINRRALKAILERHRMRFYNERVDAGQVDLVPYDPANDGEVACRIIPIGPRLEKKFDRDSVGWQLTVIPLVEPKTK